MNYYLYDFSAICTVLTVKENPKVHEIKHGARPSLFIDSLFFPSKISVNNNLGKMRLGEKGEIKIEVIVDELSGSLFTKGASFYLCDGPQNTIAACQICRKPKASLI